MKTFTVEFEMRGHGHQCSSQIDAWDIEQAREIFLRDNQRCEIISITEN